VVILADSGLSVGSPCEQHYEVLFRGYLFTTFIDFPAKDVIPKL